MTFLTFTLPILFTIPLGGGVSEQLCRAELTAGIKTTTTWFSISTITAVKVPQISVVFEQEVT